jgi:hypothetical protein
MPAVIERLRLSMSPSQELLSASTLILEAKNLAYRAVTVVHSGASCC